MPPRPTSNPCCSRSGGSPPGAHRSRGPRHGPGRRPGGRPCPRSRRRQPTDGGRGARRRRARVALRRRACSRSAGRRAGASGPRRRAIRRPDRGIDARPIVAKRSMSVMRACGPGTPRRRSDLVQGQPVRMAPVQTWIGAGRPHAWPPDQGPGRRATRGSSSHPGRTTLERRRLASASPTSIIRHRSTALAASVGWSLARAPVTAGFGPQPDPPGTDRDSARRTARGMRGR